MGLFLAVGRRKFKNLRRLFLAFALACLISLELPDPSVVRAQEVPGLYASVQESNGTPAVSTLTSPFASLFAEQQGAVQTEQASGFSFVAEGLFMNLRSDSQVFAQTARTYFGSLDSAGAYHTIKPGRVNGVRVGLGYERENWDTRLLYARFKANPRSAQVMQDSATYLGANNPYAATLPIVPLTTYQAEAGFNANVWDFQAGYSVRLGQSRKARLYAGISYVEAQNTLDGTGTPNSGGSLSVSRDARYRAWGPKVGLDVTCPLGESGLSLRGSVGVGSLFGTQKLTSDNKISGITGNLLDDSQRQNVVSVEGEAGIGYSFPSMDVTLGYRIERFSFNNLRYVDPGSTISSGSPVQTGKASSAQYLEGGFLRVGLKL